MPEPWYADGLRFACTRCGNCCTGSPGTVLVTDDEIVALAGHLGMSVDAFRAENTRTLPSSNVSLRERRDGRCIFFDRSRGCTVYESRPRQCRTWPFWGSVVESPERWTEEAADCPGMNRGPRHSAAAIRRIAEDDGTTGGHRTRGG